jgi:quinol monooxygenase YgiN
MRRVIVQYRVKSDRVEENEAAIRKVYEALHREAPGGLRYATFKAADGVSFVHIASVETDDGVNPLLAIAAFKEFTAGAPSRCEEPPVTRELTEIGSYRVF